MGRQTCATVKIALVGLAGRRRTASVAPIAATKSSGSESQTHYTPSGDSTATSAMDHSTMCSALQLKNLDVALRAAGLRCILRTHISSQDLR